MKIQEMKMLPLRLLCLLPIIGTHSLLPSDGFPLLRRLRPRPSRYEGCVAMLGTEEPGAIRRACGDLKKKTKKSNENAFSYLQKKEYVFFPQWTLLNPPPCWLMQKRHRRNPFCTFANLALADLHPAPARRSGTSGCCAARTGGRSACAAWCARAAPGEWSTRGHAKVNDSIL